MNEIILSAERYAVSPYLGHPEHHTKYLTSPKTDDSAIARAAVAASKERSCAAILVLTNHGTLPRLVAAYRPDIPIYAFCPSAKMGRQLQIYRGIHPIVGLKDVPQAKRAQQAVADATAMGYIRSGDEVVVVAMEEDEVLGRTGLMKLVTVP